MFEVPDRWQIWQDDATMSIELADSWQYNPDAYFVKGRAVPLYPMGNANSQDDWDMARHKVAMLNHTQPHSFILYAATKAVSFVDYHLDRLFDSYERA